MGTLFVVATPIGNLGDLSTRAADTLRSVAAIAAEDTRHSIKLLNHLGIRATMISLHAFNERARVDRVVDLLAEGDVALITDAGTPAVSDPGALLVDAVLEAGYSVSPIPGASALTAALSASGLISGPFMMLGFLPRAAGERRLLLGSALGSGFGLVIFEAGNRVAATIAEIAGGAPGRRVALARELTKLHEEIVRASAASLAARMGDVATRGECVIVVEGGEPSARSAVQFQPAIDRLLGAGLRPREIAELVAELSGVARSAIYPEVLARRDARAASIQAAADQVG